MHHLQVQVCHSAGVKVLQSLQCFSDEERHLLLHQLIVGDEEVEQTAVLQPGRHCRSFHLHSWLHEYDTYSGSADLQLQDQHQGGGRLVRVQHRHQLGVLDMAEEICLMSHLLLFLHLLTHKLHSNLNRKT